MLKGYGTPSVPSRPVLLIFLAIGSTALLSADLRGLNSTSRTGNYAQACSGSLGGSGTVAKRAASAFSGVALTNLDSKNRAELSLPMNIRGALVTSLNLSSPACKAGLRTGEVILQIDDRLVKDAQDAVDDAARALGSEIVVKVRNGQSARYIILPNSSAV